MVKKIILGLFLLIIIGVTIVVVFVADKVDADFNPTILEKPYAFTDRSVELYNSLEFVADLHCDALMWQRNMNTEHDFGHVDIPRLQKGNVAFQAFTMVTKSPDNLNFDNNGSDSDRITNLVIGQGRPLYAWFSLFGRAKYQCKQLQKAAKKNEYFRLISNKTDFQEFLKDRKKDKRHVGAFLGAEGGHCLEGKIENLGKLYDMGMRMLGPTHFFDNELGGSAHGIEKGGLSDFGREVILEMVERNMIIDVAHSSSELINDVLELTDAPIISSHTGVNGHCASPRNLTDDQLGAIAERGGLVGIAFFDEAVCGATVKNIAIAMKYVRDLIGIEYVALGSDFDGTVDVPFDATGFPLLVEALLEEGFSADEIRLAMGDNVKNFFLQHLPD